MTKKQQRLAILALASVPLIMTLGNSMLIPILPLLEKKLSISKLQSSYIITVYSIVTIIFIPLSGYLSDRFGRKTVIVPALILTGIGGLISGFAAWKMDNAFIVVLIGRVLQGIGASGAMPVVIPLVSDMFEQEEKASATLGIIETSNTIGKVLSPILGSALTAIIWFLPFFSIPVLSTISLLLILFFIKQKEDDDEAEFKMSEYWKQIKDVFSEHRRWLFSIFAIGAIVMFILFGFLFYASTILEDDYNFKGVTKGFLLAIPLFALATASFVTGKLIKDKMKTMKWIVVIGLAIAGVATIGIPFKKNYIFLLTIFFICGAGIGMTLPCLDSIITENIEKDVRGSITSFYSAMRFAGVATGPPAIAFLMKKELYWIVALFVFLALIALYLAWMKIYPKRKA
ncbi:MAG TPA: MFS transporter [Pseudogracilibacillus sp.]|nr:MFS transporter [Pseudogracilibacillus sp.]